MISMGKCGQVNYAFSIIYFSYERNCSHGSLHTSWLTKASRRTEEFDALDLQMKAACLSETLQRVKHDSSQ